MLPEGRDKRISAWGSPLDCGAAIDDDDAIIAYPGEGSNCGKRSQLRPLAPLLECGTKYVVYYLLKAQVRPPEPSTYHILLFAGYVVIKAAQLSIKHDLEPYSWI
jgi:hypothetical protein